MAKNLIKNLNVGSLFMYRTNQYYLVGFDDGGDGIVAKRKHLYGLLWLSGDLLVTVKDK